MCLSKGAPKITGSATVGTTLEGITSAWPYRMGDPTLAGMDREQCGPKSPIGRGHPCSTTKGREKRMEVLGLTDGTWLLAALVLALYLLVIWMLLEIIFRADFSGSMKVAWIFVALLLAPVAVPIWFLWVRRKDYSRT